MESACIFPLAIEDHRFKTSPRSPSSEWKVDVLNNSMAPVRYMHQPTLEKAEALDNWVWDLVKQIIAKLPEESFTESTINPGSSSQLIHCPSVSPSPLRGALSGSSSQPVTKATGSLERTTYLRPTYVRLQTSSLVAGRVASSTSTLSSQLTTEAKENDLQMTKNRLQPGNAAVIGLRRVEGAGGSADAMTRLEFPMANSCVYSIFSGQPVILRATNPTGRQLNVTDVFTTMFYSMRPTLFTPIRSAVPKAKCAQAVEYWSFVLFFSQLNFMSDLCVMVATGPYTFANSNDPSLLLTFLREVKRNRPHVLILLGPIVDANHPVVQTYCETTYEELFQSRLNSVAEYCSHLDVQLIVVPSWRDAHHDPVYPTPPFDSDWTQQTTELIGHFRNVHFVWDPTVVSIGGYVFGFTSVDVLFHLSSEEISSGCSGDRMARLCQHILSSRTFYPVHPPADDLPLDYVLWTQRAQLSSAPHCLICPSRLRQFVKDVDGVLCINPGHVSRGQSSGSYATITIHTDTPNDHEHGISDDAANGSTCSWSIANRTAVHVYRL
ncbi:unnamed protein product [Echinostoma caproni]|uniref:DNA polymerase alpha subunit B n=1 Tax=Echinostoma caproni TaxID=27848 RepID=A0A3P8G167_9TREM|nr:unnamed protein product [Echinostoma caproni]